MNAATSTHKTLDDARLEPASSKADPLGLPSADRSENVEQFFRRFAFPHVPPDAQAFDFGDFLTDANRRVLLRDLEGAELVVEIGSLLGASTRFLLEAKPSRRLICVDPWDRVYPDCLPQFATGEEIFQTFLANLAEFSSRVDVMRMPSSQALPIIAAAGVCPDGAYVDGDHQYEAVWNDLQNLSELFPRIPVVGDDFGPGFRGVVGACLEFAADRQKQLFVDGDAWSMPPPERDEVAPSGRPAVESGSQSPLVSIITTCKGRLEHLRRTLPAMLAQRFRSQFEVIVVDYGCPDDADQWCLELGAPNLIAARALGDTEDFNLSRARNLGARIARGKILAFVDADIVLAPSWLDAATRAIRKRSAVVSRAERFEGQSWDRCGTCAIDAHVFHKLRGYDESIADWSLADFDLYQRCRDLGSEAFFDPFLLTPIRHSDELRVQFHREKSRIVAEQRNREYLASRAGGVNPRGYALGRMKVSRAATADENARPISSDLSSKSNVGRWSESLVESVRLELEHSQWANNSGSLGVRLPGSDLNKRIAQCERCEQRIGNRCRLLGRRLKERASEFGLHCPLGKWPSLPLEQLVTIGVTTFMRPDSLARLRASIKRMYPNLPLEIVDTQSNLSWGRNRLAAELETPYLLLCEDDFEFYEHTNIETLVGVLNHDDEIGAAGGVLTEPVGQVSQPVHADDKLQLSRASGTTISIASATNAKWYRRELLQQFPWDEDLPVSEHRDWYYRVARSRQWRMAVCRDVSILHHHDQPAGYAGFRNPSFRTHLRNKNGFRFLPPPSRSRLPSGTFSGTVDRDASRKGIDTDRRDRSQSPVAAPNIILFGVGHSGTSIVAKQLFALGWNRADADEQFAESVSVRRLNRQILQTGRFDHQQAEKILRNLPSPWVVKDPRFVEFLPHWLRALSRLDQPPLLLWLRRDADALRQSYLKRNELLADNRPGVRGRPVEELSELARRNFEKYPWPKFSLDVEDIADAAQLFDAARVRKGV